ncbi:anaerobic ribonucleoside-triphosphate reductase-activating protein [Cellulomonas hominis]|uniref:Anaerobic ribonucleoside-triphosphate reductase-activating protein n=1 Tax=Cellulomonas hominis TaxID=156981 RepID=A0A511FHV5_9CELL|nr:anaerobic ribonucleoside-triphosphate reductase activating protein [Cellulomonas hominis]MBB5474645.1 anaerobic ribonucleoside-triphosphate reductase activating protein [Cellulomonas hominis]NKY05997.1 anaerobic ribonucleoside-triphosphate reductase activating protein [Cellulomonas hominis]GEL48831.1 anaerobic ribonucleoside-triphosphate reductase-activating protein [Cellulomonas hominis]
MTRTPAVGQWQARTLSQGRVADYKPFVMVDGEGVRCSLYVSGCPFACAGCFNEAAWSFRYGTEFGPELAQRIAADLRHAAVQGLSLLGGEPFLNTGVCLEVVHALRAEHGAARDVWCWTGYTYDELAAEAASGTAPDKAELLGLVDVLVDGRFELAQRDQSLAFRGSRNQRILDVPASLAAGAPVQWQGSARAEHSVEQVDRRRLI